jgi:hypothetical protein
VDWIDDLDSRVDIIATALADLRGMARLGAGFARGSIQVPQLRAPGWAGGRTARGLSLQVARFTVIGVASTIAYLALFLLLRLAMPAQAANVISLLLTALGQAGRLTEICVLLAANLVAPGRRAIGTVHRNEMATQGERTN